jgi:hypothetical protein
VPGEPLSMRVSGSNYEVFAVNYEVFAVKYEVIYKAILMPYYEFSIEFITRG